MCNLERCWRSWCSVADATGCGAVREEEPWLGCEQRCPGTRILLPFCSISCLFCSMKMQAAFCMGGAFVSAVQSGWGRAEDSGMDTHQQCFLLPSLLPSPSPQFFHIISMFTKAGTMSLMGSSLVTEWKAALQRLVGFILGPPRTRTC